MSQLAFGKPPAWPGTRWPRGEGQPLVGETDSSIIVIMAMMDALVHAAQH